MRSDRPSRSNVTGLAAAVAGALIGAWLGFHATADLAALVTAIVGAIAGANLTLIGLDVALGTVGREPRCSPPPRRLRRARRS